MLTALTVEDFKSYHKATLPLAELTVLIGANASGKSNLIEALQLLSWIARGQRLSEVLYALRDRQLEMRGPALRFARDVQSTFRIGIIARTELLGDLDLKITLGFREGELRVIDERLLKHGDAGMKVLYSAPGRHKQSKSDGLLAFYGPDIGEAKLAVPCIDRQAVFTQLISPALFAEEKTEGQQEITQATQLIQSALETTLFLDPIPRRMRDYSFAVERVLQGDGSNLSAVLFDLCEHQQRKKDVLEFVRTLPEQDILDLGFLKGPRGEIMAQLTESFGAKAQTYEAALLSDGTLRVLAVAAALLSVHEGSLVVIEEVDNGVHPSRAALLLDKIQSVAQQRKLRVLLTTHNPALLDAIPLDAVPDVVACYRDPSDGDSRLMPLSQLPDYPELVAQGPVGQLVTRGILERYLKSPRTPEEKAAQAKRVLEMLQTPPSEP